MSSPALPTTISERAACVIAGLREPGAESIARLLAEDIIMELPFHPVGAMRIEGREGVLQALDSVSRLFTRFRINAHEIHECAERNTVIVEATGFGLPVAGGEVYQNRYVFVLTFSDGEHISRWREYLNPYPVMNLPVAGY